jgi:hypothetical protein
MFHRNSGHGFSVYPTSALGNLSQRLVHFACSFVQEPNNELYLKALEMTEKAPSLHQELQKQLASQQVILGGGTPSPSAATSKGGKKKKQKESDFKYDVMGWIVLAVGVIAWAGLAKSSMPPPPPPSLNS